MTGAGTTKRTIRIDDSVWEQAKLVASRRGESVSDAVRAGLFAYIASGGEGGPTDRHD